jgi:hypothetical protein
VIEKCLLQGMSNIHGIFTLERKRSNTICKIVFKLLRIIIENDSCDSFVEYSIAVIFNFQLMNLEELDDFNFEFGLFLANFFSQFINSWVTDRDIRCKRAMPSFHSTIRSG